MKKGMLLLLLVGSLYTQAQSLKEALYGGKLKNEPGTVIKKGDDLSTKIDTTQKLVKDSAILAKKASDSSFKRNDSATAIAATPDKKDSVTAGDNISPSPTIAAKDNNTALKEYITNITSTLQTEVLLSKKIKKGSYYVSLSYSIGTDGQLSFNNVLVTPENGFLQQAIKDRISVDAPKLQPVLSSTGAPRKVSKNYNFTLTKE